MALNPRLHLEVLQLCQRHCVILCPCNCPAKLRTVQLPGLHAAMQRPLCPPLVAALLRVVMSRLMHSPMHPPQLPGVPCQGRTLWAWLRGTELR